MNKENWLLMEVTDEILAVANCYNDVTTSDLQGMAMATARKLIAAIVRLQNDTATM